MRRFRGFTLIELLVVILILAILMAIALPLYLRAVRDSEKQTCRANMQTIANAAQAWKVRNPSHQWPQSMDELFTNPDPNPNATTPGPSDVDLIAPGPQCPSDPTEDNVDYKIEAKTDGTIVITCVRDSWHNDVGAALPGFIPGVSTK